MRSNSSSRRRSQPAGSLRTFRLEAPPQEVVTVEYVGEAPQFERRQRIHPRRMPPLVRSGPEEPDPDPSPPTELAAHRRLGAQPAPHALTDELTLVRNTEITSVGGNNMASNV